MLLYLAGGGGGGVRLAIDDSPPENRANEKIHSQIVVAVAPIRPWANSAKNREQEMANSNKGESERVSLNENAITLRNSPTNILVATEH